MLYIITSDKRQREWVIGDNSTPILNLTDDIQTIMASGPELDLIKERFGVNIFPVTHKYNTVTYSIPMPQGGDIIWYGDIAKTIVSNIMV